MRKLDDSSMNSQVKFIGLAILVAIFGGGIGLVAAIIGVIVLVLMQKKKDVINEDDDLGVQMTALYQDRQPTHADKPEELRDSTEESERKSGEAVERSQGYRHLSPAADHRVRQTQELNDLLSAGIIERDEYNDRIHALNR